MLGTAAIEHAGAARGPHREFLGAPVAMSPAEPERLDGGHHEPRIQFPETFVIQSDPVHIRRPNVVNQNVGLRNHPLENRETFRARNVERDAEFVGVEIEKQAALLGMGRVAGERSARACAVADTGAFHLDHLGAHIGHQLGRVWRRNHLANFDDFETCQRSRHLNLRPALSRLVPRLSCYGTTLRNGLTSTRSKTPCFV